MSEFIGMKQIECNELKEKLEERTNLLRGIVAAYSVPNSVESEFDLHCIIDKAEEHLKRER